MMIPFDLKRAADSTADQNTLASSTQTVSTTGTHIDGRSGFNRFVVSVSAIIGATGYSIALQGSNDQDITDTTEPANWTTIATIVPAATGETSSVFQTEYKYYRIVNTITNGTPSITYTASLVETYVDRWIIHKAFTLIFRDFSKLEGDIWQTRSDSHERMYAQAIQSFKFTTDDNDDNLITDSDTIANSQQIKLVR
jgi:hypothetical protein